MAFNAVLTFFLLFASPAYGQGQSQQNKNNWIGTVGGVVLGVVATHLIKDFLNQKSKGDRSDILEEISESNEPLQNNLSLLTRQVQSLEGRTSRVEEKTENIREMVDKGLTGLRRSLTKEIEGNTKKIESTDEAFKRMIEKIDKIAISTAKMSAQLEMLAKEREK